MRSLTRPTVPTTTWPPPRSWACWVRIGAPPKTATTSMPLRDPYARRAWVTWMHSSRVGVSTSAWMASSSGSTYSIIGSPKAAVLPEPVWAWPITSRPSRSGGTACSWMGDGFSYPTSSSACRTGAERPRSAKVVTPPRIGGASPPLAVQTSEQRGTGGDGLEDVVVLRVHKRARVEAEHRPALAQRLGEVGLQPPGDDGRAALWGFLDHRLDDGVGVALARRDLQHARGPAGIVDVDEPADRLAAPTHELAHHDRRRVERVEPAEQPPHVALVVVEVHADALEDRV